MKSLNIVVPMAGSGQRFADAGYNIPKFLINIFDKSMIENAVNSVGIDGNYIYIVLEQHYEEYSLESILNNITPNCTILKQKNKTDGAAQTVLISENLINNDTPLLIMNCDQIIEWNVDNFSNFIDIDLDGAIVTFKGNGTKWSYVTLNSDGIINEVAEKKQISNDATAGIYYWSKGSDYVKYAKQMIQKNIKINNEFYVAPVYNEAILDGKKIYPFFIDKMFGVGTPEDLNLYLSMKERYV